MKYYFDTEFAEGRGTLKLISIGIVDDKGGSYYAENSCFDVRDANDWVKENVIPNLKWHENLKSTKGFNNVSNQGVVGGGRKYEVYGTPEVILDSLKDYLELTDPSIGIDFKREFYAYYGAYDWVALCSIFGTMVDLPAGMPMFCRDLKPMLDDSTVSPPDNPENEHNALVDAKWNKELYEAIISSTHIK